jgi:uncharacterized peroxidase-related enzyme
MTSHGAALRLLTKDPVLVDQLLADYKAARGLEPKERAMLDFAVKLTREPDDRTEADLGALLKAGWTDRDVHDIVEVAAMFNLTNRLANALGWMPNEEYHSLGR